MKNDSPSDKKIALVYILVAPFVASAAVHFLPLWVSTPLFVVLGLIWLGSLIIVAEGK